MNAQTDRREASDDELQANHLEITARRLVAAHDRLTIPGYTPTMTDHARFTQAMHELADAVTKP